MGMGMSSNTLPTIAEYQSPYMVSETTTKSQLPKMALSFEAQVRHQDDISHDTLMGLQELDSHLAIFEGGATPGKGSSTSGPPSDIVSDDLHISIDIPFNNHLNGPERQDSTLVFGPISSLDTSSAIEAARSAEIPKYAGPLTQSMQRSRTLFSIKSWQR